MALGVDYTKLPNNQISNLYSTPLETEKIKKEPLKITSFVIDRSVLTGPDLKYSNDKTKIEINNSVNKENFCLVPFFKKAERIAIIKSSLPVSEAIVF